MDEAKAYLIAGAAPADGESPTDGENSVLENLAPKGNSLLNTQDPDAQADARKSQSKSILEEAAERRTAVTEVLVEKPGGGAEFGLNGKLFAKIAFWWLITVPVAFGVSALIELIVK